MWFSHKALFAKNKNQTNHFQSTQTEIYRIWLEWIWSSGQWFNVWMYDQFQNFNKNSYARRSLLETLCILAMLSLFSFWDKGGVTLGSK